MNHNSFYVCLNISIVCITLNQLGVWCYITTHLAMIFLTISLCMWYFQL